MENVNIKDVLTEISSKIIEENNKPFDFKKFKKTGVGNHIYNEEGFQLKMGFELLKKFDLNGNIEFEKVYHNIEKGKKEKTDIYFFLNGVRYGIELKFKTWGIKNVMEKEARGYYFVWQGAQPNGRHDFYYDIHRLNNLIGKKIIDVGYQIFITNDAEYLMKKKQTVHNTYKFSMEEGKSIPLKLPIPDWKRPSDKKHELILDYADGEKIKWIHDTKEAINDLPKFSFVIIELKRKK
tara:strand:- start:1318 stop:2028 length:711 start_codon:yes stop_codon:yes gene_type:complete